MIDVFPLLTQSSRLLTVNSALLLSDEDQDILSAVALSTDTAITMYLFRLTFAEGLPTGATISATLSTNDKDSTLDRVANWQANIVPLMRQIERQTEATWTLDSKRAAQLIPGSGSLTILKLYRFGPNNAYEWHAFILIVWPLHHGPTRDEQTLFQYITPTASAVIASHQHVALKLLKLHSALLTASSEADILEIMSLGAYGPDGIYLLDVSGVEKTLGATVIARWPGGQNNVTDRQVSIIEMPLLAFLNDLPGPTWVAEDVTSMSIAMPSFFDPVGGLAAIKLFDEGGWFGLILFTWRDTHPFTDDEKYVLTAMARPASSLIASRRRHQEALKNLDRLRELDKLKDDFLYSMSHELRTPLNGIISVADLILSGMEGEVNPQVQTDVRIILESGEHLLALVEEILDFAKMEAGSLKLILEPVQPVEVAREAVRAIDLKMLPVRLAFPDDLPTIYADRLRLRQILLNLVSNAIKFSDRGTIEIGAWQEDRMVVIYVRDEGVGIEAAHWQVIFEPFRQLDDALTRRHGGTGLGLPICKRLTELHGGHIWVTSQLGQGSTFYLSLPTRQGPANENPVY